MAAREFEVLYGGAAGGGKSDALLYGGLRQVHHPDYRALLLRQTFPELRDLMDRAQQTFPKLGAKWHEEQKRWVFPSGASYEFGYCSRFADVVRYRGQEYTYIAFDEIGDIADHRIWLFLMGRCRPKAADLIPMMRASANPGGAGHAWLKRRFVDATDFGRRVYWDPETGLPRRFIPAKVTDNPTLLRRNPAYINQLRSLPEILRKQLLEGDWSAGSGLALSELDRSVHLVTPFDVPDHWCHFGGFDWGYAHPWCFVWLASSPSGTLYVVDAVWGQRQLPWEIAQRIKSKVPVERLGHIAAGRDCWAQIKARGEDTPTIAEQFVPYGLFLTQANQDRKQGLNLLRKALAWRRKAGDRDGEPDLLFMRTEGVLRLFEELETMVLDPDDPEDALKRNANVESGEPGDDGYDALRYAVASRPPTPKEPEDTSEFDAFSKEAILTELEKLRVHSPSKPKPITEVAVT
ncbi:MAG: terminase family protein [candidate division KSB1 bacterium]|nr:terminase family protein [candidate division KSB1 bacterium]